MKFSTLLAAVAPLTVLAAPVAVETESIWALAARQAGQVNAPGDAKFCNKVDPAPSEEEIQARHDKFVDAFLVKKDVKLAFTYIAPEYINHNPMAQNGAQWALNLLGGIWGGQNIRVRRTMYRDGMSYLNYDGSYGSNIIDRYRWEGGCIVEHWDAGEKWPAN
ncbi:hypothetical protein V8F33_012385 [Rhypophila sp. PSN 637]